MNLIERYRAWRKRRTWPAKLQLEHLRIQVEEDARWMAHDPKISALCERYAGMLAEDWMSKPRLSVSDFRSTIEADPHRSARVAPLSRKAPASLRPSYPRQEAASSVPARSEIVHTNSWPFTTSRTADPEPAIVSGGGGSFGGGGASSSWASASPCDSSPSSFNSASDSGSCSSPD